jgi:hypothetical protein
MISGQRFKMKACAVNLRGGELGAIVANNSLGKPLYCPKKASSHRSKPTLDAAPARRLRVYGAALIFSSSGIASLCLPSTLHAGTDEKGCV